MDRDTINFVRSVLPRGRTVFYDFPDRYAFMLLEAAADEDGVPISELKAGRFGALLRKPRVREFLSGFGNPVVRAADFRAAWPADTQAFRLTLGTWPGLDGKPTPRWDQITRWGWNLVLQLNLPASHRRVLSKLVPSWKRLVDFPHHPIAEGGELTLAWSRIDLDLETREALIEEIQSDWVRDAEWFAKRSRPGDSERWREYFDNHLKPQTKKWPETILTAAIDFLLREIGIRTVFYHTFESGRKLKRMGRTSPPRSIYTDLPEKYCFELTHNGPLFIRDSARKELRDLFTDPETKWYVLDLDR